MALTNEYITCPSCKHTFKNEESGNGTRYADKMKKPTKMHIKIMTVMMKAEPKRYLKKEIYEIFNVEYPSNYLTVNGAISQLVRKKIFHMTRLPTRIVNTDLSITTKVKPQYLFDREYANNVLSTGVF